MAATRPRRRSGLKQSSLVACHVPHAVTLTTWRGTGKAASARGPMPGQILAFSRRVAIRQPLACSAEIFVAVGVVGQK